MSTTKPSDCRTSSNVLLLNAVTILGCCLGFFPLPAQAAEDHTVALWLFDEHRDLYPSSVLNDAGPHGYALVLGRGGRIVEGKFGHALEACEPLPLQIQAAEELKDLKNATYIGVYPAAKAPGRTVEPMNWTNALFTALITCGDRHLRRRLEYANATETRLNLGDFDWTVEFWYRPTRLARAEGVVFEVGQGPRGENDKVTRLSLHPDRPAFFLSNQPSGTKLVIPTAASVLDPAKAWWYHLSFVYSATARQLRHYVDGELQELPPQAALRPLPRGEEAYFSIGRDGLWKHPLPGCLDELRISDTALYVRPFTPPGSYSKRFGLASPQSELFVGPPLLFGNEAKKTACIELGSRKHLFVDDALLAETKGVTFTANPPRRTERVIDKTPGKHGVVIEDEQGVLRFYHGGPGDSVAVMTSRDGVRWHAPDLGRGDHHGARNIVLRDSGWMGCVIRDPNAPPESRWKYSGGVRGSGIFVYTSPDGWSFRRHEVAALPFRAGSQSNLFYDDQRQLYVGHHRTDYWRTPGGETERRFALTEVKDLLAPWPYEVITPERTRAAARTQRLAPLAPWYLDDGPLTPGGIGLELPTAFGPHAALDPEGTDVYVTKAIKYPWAPDTYLAFPAFYFHYWDDGPETRQLLGRKERGLGSGTTEVQLATSRDGLAWKRYPRPVYVGLGRQEGTDLHMVYMVQGLIRRGEEIWQYYLGTGGYHSPWQMGTSYQLYRVVQRLDGFVSADADYTGGLIRTRPLVFQGNRLVLNIDTAATGFAQVGILDEQGQPIPGYALKDCVYINGDSTAAEVEWLGKGKDLAALAGRPVQLVFRMRGTKLYAMQFVSR